MHQNVDGLINKSDQLMVNLYNLEKTSNEIDVVCITEHNMLQ